ncbi:MAG: HEPN domain-containing protein [Tepidibacillus sp.]
MLDEKLDDFRTLLNIRNSIAHGGDVKFSEVQNAIDKLKVLKNELDNHFA